jgi:hypothetical protein
VKLTTKPNSITEFELEFDGGVKGFINRRKMGHRDTWTLTVHRKGAKAGSTASIDALHYTNADNFETVFFKAMTITSDDIDGWEEEHRVTFAEELSR